MWRYFLVVWLLAVSAAIRVPVDDKDESTTDTIKLNDSTPTQESPAPVYYESEEAEVDSYLIPPSPHNSAEDKQDVIPTYLLPPAQEKQEDFYYVSADTGAQSDWYPISQSVPQNPSILLPQAQQEPIPILMVEPSPTPQIIYENPRTGKSHQQEQQVLPVPSRQLEPPLETAQNHFILPTPSEELELPYEEQGQHFVVPTEEVYELPILDVNQKFNPQLLKNTPVNFRLKNAEPTISLHLTPPKPLLSPYKKPTKLYPKKYPGVFKPVPIPLAQFAEENSGDVPKARPVIPFNPAANVESEYSPEDKEAYLYEKTKQKRKQRKEKLIRQQQPPVEELHSEKPAEEQETSETHFRYPGRNVYPAPLRQAPPTAPPRPLSGTAPVKPPPAGDRTEFRMHGMKGPHSYQFGYDTGKGKNRQFRFEERDNDGHVRGHYGYVDKNGKLRVVNYDAHPEHGFRADAPTDTEP